MRNYIVRNVSLPITRRINFLCTRALKAQPDRSRWTTHLDGFINYVRTRALRYHNAAIRSVVKRFDHRDAAIANVRESEQWICKCCVCRGGTANGGLGWGSVKSRQSHSGIHSSQAYPLPPPGPPARSLVPRSNEIFRNIAFECD